MILDTVPVFRTKINLLPVGTNGVVFKNLMESRFGRSGRKFSSLGADQGHKQNNKKIDIFKQMIGPLLLKQC